MSGIIGFAGYLPHNRLERKAIGEAMGKHAGNGTRTVASYDEDTTTMGVEAGRLVLRPFAEVPEIDQLWFATAEPAYVEKTNATTIHTALRLDTNMAAFDFGGAARSGVGALLAALRSDATSLVVSAGIRTGLPTGDDESSGGDGAAAILVGDGSSEPILAELVGSASATHEFLDRWKHPGWDHTRTWAERFSEGEYLVLAGQAFQGALKAADLTPGDLTKVVITGVHSRAMTSFGRKSGLEREQLADDLSRTVGCAGAAHAGLALVSAFEHATAGDRIALVNLADGADCLIFGVTDAISTYTSSRTMQSQIDSGVTDLSYTKFLSWRGYLTPEPPRRPEPNRVSGSAAGRNKDWKFGFIGSRDIDSGAVHLPPARVSMKGGSIDHMEPVPMADVPATVVTVTVDRVSYSPSPPIIAAIVDFDGGGRMPVELTDCAVGDINIGDRVEMSFRRLHSSDGIHNYFWKARPIRGEG